MNKLQEIAEYTKKRIDKQKLLLPPEELIKMAQSACRRETVPMPAIPFESVSSFDGPLSFNGISPSDNISSLKVSLSFDCSSSFVDTLPSDDSFPFEIALRHSDLAFICEIKRASPSKGIIAEPFPYLDIAGEYETAGAAAISVLTEPHYFKGNDLYLNEIAGKVSIPLLRKDFIIDSYMIYEAKILGAAAVLLICALLESNTLAGYISIAHSLGLSALVETHTEAEVEMALNAGARIIGVNNRDLETFGVDIAVSERLRKMVPLDIVFVSESGIHCAQDVRILRRIGVNAVLVGETLMRSLNRKATLDELRGNTP